MGRQAAGRRARRAAERGGGDVRAGTKRARERAAGVDGEDDREGVQEERGEKSQRTSLCQHVRNKAK